jgi:TrmH family RNA methyltransferase
MPYTGRMTSHMSAKLIKSLHQKKHRKETGMFLVEGTKNVLELLASDYKLDSLYSTQAFKAEHAPLLAQKNVRAQVVEASELDAFGTLEHNDGALAVAIQKELPLPSDLSGITLALDDIRDPGNLGTLIRIADWYGVQNIVCSPSCVDWHNPKVIAASMGSFTRVAGHYAELPAFLKQAKLPVLGAFLDGASAHAFAFPENGILVIGSESHGISQGVEKCVTQKITIPSFGGAESLNAGVAGGIILDRWKGSL